MLASTPVYVAQAITRQTNQQLAFAGHPDAHIVGVRCLRQYGSFYCIGRLTYQGVSVKEVWDVRIAPNGDLSWARPRVVG